MNPEKEPKPTNSFVLKRNYIFGVLLFSAFFLFTFLAAPNKKPSDLSTLNDVVIDSIEYHSTVGRHRTLETRLKFLGDERRFAIKGMDYQNFNHKDFKKEVYSGDTVSIQYNNTSPVCQVYTFIKNGKNYGDLQKSNEHRDKHDLWIRILAGYGLSVCLAALFLKKEPKIGFGLILIVGMILLVIVLSLTIGLKYVVNVDYMN